MPLLTRKKGRHDDQRSSDASSDQSRDLKSAGKNKGAERNHKPKQTITKDQVKARILRDIVVSNPDYFKNPDRRTVRNFERTQSAYRQETIRKQRDYRNPLIGQSSASSSRKFEAYNMKKENWITPSKDIIDEMKSLKSFLSGSDNKDLFEEDRQMARLLTFVTEDGKCPPELLNDLFFLTQKRIDDTKERYGDYIRRVSNRLNRAISEGPHITHRIDASFYTSLLGRDWDGTSLDLNIDSVKGLNSVDPTHSILKDVSFPSSDSSDADEKKIADYRNDEIESIDKLCDLIDKEFTGGVGFSPKTKHDDVRNSVHFLKDRLKALKESDDEGLEEHMKLLRLTIIKTMADCKTYMAQSDDKVRLLLSDQMLTRLHALNTPDNKVLALPDVSEVVTPNQANEMSARESIVETEKVQQSIDNINQAVEQLTPHLDEQSRNSLEGVIQELVLDSSLYFLPSSDKFIPKSFEMLQKIQGLIGKAVSIVNSGGKMSTGVFKDTMSGVKLSSDQAEFVIDTIPRLVSDIRAIIKSNNPSGRQALNLVDSAVGATKDLASLTKGIIKLPGGAADIAGDGAKLAADTTGGIASVLGAGINVGKTINGGLAFYKTIKRIGRVNEMRKDNKTVEGRAKDRNIDEILQGIKERAKRKAIHSFVKAAGGTIAVAGSAVAISATAGAAIPAIVTPLIGAAGAFIGASSTIEKSVHYSEKAKENKLGVERQNLADKIFDTMRELSISGNEEWVKQLASTLTNNDAKVHLMMAGCNKRSTLKEQKIAKDLIMEKLKTW